MSELGNDSPAPARRPLGSSRGRRRMAVAVIAGGAAITAIVALAFWIFFSGRESTDNAQIEGDIVPVAARVGGMVRDVHFLENQPVAAGDVLVSIDPTDYEVAVRRAEAELADAKAAAAAARTAVPITSTTTTSQLTTAGASLAAARKEVEAARARLEEARANHDRTRADLERYRQLVAKDEIPRQQFDTAVTAETAARSTVDAAQASLAAAESHVVQAEAQLRAAGTGPEQVEVSNSRASAAEAAVRKMEAALEQARLNLSYTTVRAPVAGVVGRKGVQPGQVIQAGQPLLALVPLERIWVVANFKENQLRRMRPGQAASVYVDAYGRSYRGHVESIGGATAAKFSLLPPENATGNFVKVVQRVPVKIVLENDQDPERLLRPGMSVVPTVITR